MNMTLKQVEIVRKKTPKCLVGKELYLDCVLGYASPSSANWCYHIGYITYKGLPILVVTQFGKVI